MACWELDRGLCEEKGVGGPLQGDPALQIQYILYPVRKAFMQGRHVGHGITSTGDLGSGKVMRLFDRQHRASGKYSELHREHSGR